MKLTDDTIFRCEVFTLSQCMLSKSNDSKNLQIRIYLHVVQFINQKWQILRDFGIFRMIGSSRHYCHPLRRQNSQWGYMYRCTQVCAHVKEECQIIFGYCKILIYISLFILIRIAGFRPYFSIFPFFLCFHKCMGQTNDDKNNLFFNFFSFCMFRSFIASFSKSGIHTIF